MIMDNMQELVLEDVTFDEARQNFNRVLQRLFRSMLDSGSSDGSITLKIDASRSASITANTRGYFLIASFRVFQLSLGSVNPICQRMAYRSTGFNLI